MLSLNPIKRGDTFQFYANFKNTTTNAALTGIASKLKSQARTAQGDFVLDFVITENPAVPGQYLFKTNGTGALTKAQVLYIDIQYTDGTDIISSQTFSVVVEEDVTL